MVTGVTSTFIAHKTRIPTFYAFHVRRFSSNFANSRFRAAFPTFYAFYVRRFSSNFANYALSSFPFVHFCKLTCLGTQQYY